MQCLGKVAIGLGESVSEPDEYEVPQEGVRRCEGVRRAVRVLEDRWGVWRGSCPLFWCARGLLIGWGSLTFLAEVSKNGSEDSEGV